MRDPNATPSPAGRRDGLSRLPLHPSSLILAVGAAIFAPAAGAQERDEEARLPARGELWVEVHPSFESWHEQFALSSPLPGIADGDPEPLTADFGGPIVERLFPGLAPLLTDLNADAGALGYDPLTAADVSLGALDFGSIDAEVRRLPIALRYGVLDRVSLEVFAPVTRTKVETSFAFDSSSATLVAATSAVPDATQFFPALASAIADLQLLIDSGGLSPEEEAAARALVGSAAAFESALSTRVTARALLPRAATTAGSQIETRYTSLSAGFADFGFSLPQFALPGIATSADLQAYLGGALATAGLGSRTRSWTLGELEVGVRVGLIDTFGRPRRTIEPVPPDTAAPPAVPDTVAPPAAPGEGETPGDTAGAAPDTAGAAADTAGAAAPDTAVARDTVGVRLRELRAAAERLGARRDTAGGQPEGPAGAAAPRRGPAPRAADHLEYPGGVRLRTSLGVQYRFPLRDADRSPFFAPADPLGVPIGDGQPDIELAVYQDVGLGPKLYLVGVLRRGIQRSDELVRRVVPPDRPFAATSTTATVERDLGDYWNLRLAPRLRINDVVSLGLEYSLWRKAPDSYRFASGGGPAAELETETEETRHRLGIAVHYRTTDRARAGLARLPIEGHFVFQTAIAGSGGQTPVSSLVAGGLRVPISLF